MLDTLWQSLVGYSQASLSGGGGLGVESIRRDQSVSGSRVSLEASARGLTS